ncbi:MAG TPA: cytochrome c oxidase subunit II [Candidatus Obscuribacterales bacterium]
MNIPSSIATMLAGIALTLVSLWYGQNHGLLPVAASNEALLVDGLFNTMMTISIGLFLLVEGVLIIAILRFRRAKDDTTDGPDIDGNIPLEIVWTGIPAVIVLVIGVYSFDVYSQMGGFDPNAAGDPAVTQVAMTGDDEYGAPLMNGSSPHGGHHHMALGIGASPEKAGQMADLTVDVMGLQYAWIFTYPDTGIISGELHVPQGKDVRLKLKAQDVIHAFWLPEFRLKQDAIPGRDSELRFTPTRAGDYPVICAELCGAYHGSMVTRMYVDTPEEFEAWKQQQIASRPDINEVIASLDRPRTDVDYLTPYADDMGLEPEMLRSLHESHTGAEELTQSL